MFHLLLADRPIQNASGKIGVSAPAAAALFAVEHCWCRGENSRFPRRTIVHSFRGVTTHLGGNTMWLAALFLVPRLAKDAAWSDLSRFVRAVGITLLLLFVGTAILARPESAPLHGWLGLFQWIYLAVWFPCVVLLANRLRVSMGGPAVVSGAG